MVNHLQSNPPKAQSLKHRFPRTINARNQLAQRKAVREALQRVFVAGRRFRDGEVTTRVLVGGNLYDVDAMRLAQLQAGLSPSDLDLDPLPVEDDG